MQKLDALISWVTEDGPQIYTLNPGSIATIGRDLENNISIPQPYISRNHARIEYIGNSYVLSDLGSANGTYVNGTRVGRVPWVLQDGDRIQLHVFRLSFQLIEQPVTSDSDSAEIKVDTSKDPALPQTSILRSTSPTEEYDTFTLQRFVGPDFKPMPSPRSLVASTGFDAGRAFKLHQTVITIGYAGHDAPWEIQLQDPSVSRPHAVLHLRDDTYWISDLGSDKGTRVNGDVITAPTALKEGDVILLGDARLVFRSED